MTIATTTQRENTALGYAGPIAYFSGHTADPGATGANEAAGGTYARCPVTMTPGPVDGQVTLTGTLTVDSGTVITHVGFQTAVTGGTYLDKFAQTATSTGSIAISIVITA